MRFAVLCALNVALVAPQILAQQTTAQTPARDRPARASSADVPAPAPTPAPARGTIRGRVIGDGAEAGTPLSKVRVELSGEGRTLDWMFTDPSGRFEFGDLPAGRYSLLADKTGYATVHYGSRRDPGAPSTLDLAEGGIEDLEIRISRGAVIAGRIIDDLGEPVVGARIVVNAIRIEGTERRIQSIPRGPADSDDLGAFRVGGLAAGSYLLSVNALNRALSPPVETPVQDGRYPDSAGPTRRIGLSRTFFPASATSSGAAVIDLRPAEERLDVDVTLTPYRPATLSIAVSSSPDPALNAATTRAEAVRLGVDPAVLRSVPTVSVALAAGDNPDVEARGTGVIGFSGLNPNPPPTTVAIDPGAWVAIARRGIDGGIAHATLGPGEVQSAALAIRPASMLNGHLVFQGSTRRPAPSSVRLEVLGAGPDSGISPQLLAPSGPFAVKPDGTFSIAGILGTVELVVRAPPGWAVSQMTGANRDLLGTATTFEGGEVISDARIVLTDEIAEISGSVVDADARPAPGCTVAVFPSDAHGAFHRYRMQLAQADSAGRFVLRELPAGSYTVAASSDDTTGWTSSESLSRLRALGTVVTLAGREKTALTLVCGGSR